MDEQKDYSVKPDVSAPLKKRDSYLRVSEDEPLLVTVDHVEKVNISTDGGIKEGVRVTAREVITKKDGDEFTFHPEQHLDEHIYANHQQQQKVKSIIAEKHRWIHNTPTDVTSRQRHEKIVDINRRLQTFLVEQRQMLKRERVNLSKALDKEKIFSSREYSFCLFPENSLPKNLLDVFVNSV